MNTVTNVMSSNLVNNDKLRELSHLEQIKISGGGACYRYPKEYQNPTRWVTSGSVYAIPQKWNGRSYVVSGRGENYNRNFGEFCKSRGFRYFD